MDSNGSKSKKAWRTIRIIASSYWDRVLERAVWRLSKSLADLKNHWKVWSTYFERPMITTEACFLTVCEIVEYLCNDMLMQSGKQISIVGRGWMKTIRSCSEILCAALEIRPDNTEIMAILFPSQLTRRNAAESRKVNKRLNWAESPNWWKTAVKGPIKIKESREIGSLILYFNCGIE